VPVAFCQLDAILLIGLGGGFAGFAGARLAFVGRRFNRSAGTYAATFSCDLLLTANRRFCF
jgi:hypothetical protein